MLKNKNHWDFLEEIEAPMWVDLTLEANANNQDGDDNWFYRSHLFHQCSSREMKTAFSYSCEGDGALNFGLTGPSSPKLPSSVSRSRGKNYVGKKWGGEKEVIPIDKRHPVNVLSGTSSGVTSGSGNKKKSEPSYTRLNGNPRSISRWPSKSSSTENSVASCSKPVSSFGDAAACTLISTTKKADEGSTASTITDESGQQQQKNVGKSSCVVSQTGGVLSLIRPGGRKSCVIRQASRVEISGGRRQSRGRHSSSGKSSVGSSSNPCYDVRGSASASMHHKEKTPDSSNITRPSIAAEKIVNFSKASKTSTHKIEQRTSNYKVGINTAKRSFQQAANPKVQVQTLKRNPLGPVRVDGKLISASVKGKGKPVVGGSSRLGASGIKNVKGLAASGKENNVKLRVDGSQIQKCNGKGVAAVKENVGNEKRPFTRDTSQSPLWDERPVKPNGAVCSVNLTRQRMKLGMKA